MSSRRGKLAKSTAGAAPSQAGSERRDGHPFPIVGVGASAGGLEAFREFLAQLPADSGMAFVLVQHLDPHFESRLSDLLGKATPMPVQEAEQGLAVSPNRVYVIPPNSNLGIARGVLEVSPRGNGKGPHLPVDHLFRALAQDQQARSIGVVLSGTGSDGTLGLCEIKAAGGITFAQDAASARHAGMPQSAVESGCVDFVLAPQLIAQRLAEVGRHPYLAPLASPSELEIAEDGEPLQRVLALVRAAADVDFSLYRDTTIRRRILRRMALHGHRRWPDYVAQLESDPGEVEALYRDLLIHVTSFFRDPELFEALKARVFPEIVRERSPSAPIRIWVPGCSTGQEAYSLAIALLEFLADAPVRPPIQIFATDLSDPAAIEKARVGIYPESIEADVSAERLHRFFRREDHGYRVEKAIRDLCVFARQDVTADPPFSHLDLISCRNLLIYLATPLQKRVLQTFHYALDTPGFLVLGSSETVGESSGLFEPVDRSHRIYRRKATASRSTPHFGQGDRRLADAVASREPHPAARPSPADVQREADRVLLGRFAPPGVLVDENLDILQFRGRTGAYLESPSGEPTTQLIKMAREGLFLELRNALDEARKSRQTARRDPVRVRSGGETREVGLEVIPIQAPGGGQTCFLVLFDDRSEAAGDAGSPPASPPPDSTAPDAAEPPELARLRQELAATKEYLESMIEQRDASNEELRAANEEILSSNEELQSTNEELGTAKEELQSTNEELTTVNEQLQTRNFELVRVNDDLTNLLASIDIPVIMVGRDLRIRRFTTPAKKMMSILPTDVGRPVGDLKPVIPVPDLEELIGSVIGTGRPFEREVSDASGRWFALRLYPYSVAGDRIEGAVIVLFDVDERRKGEESLRHADRAKDEFLATLGHELRNPLASIRNATEILRAAGTDPQAVLMADDILERQLRQLTRIVDDLIDISRIVEKKIALDLADVPLSTVVETAVESCRPLFEARHHRLSVALPPEPIYLRADPVRISQVLINLLNNAAKYTERRGHVWLTAERTGEPPAEVIVSVRDSGIGIQPSLLPRVFDLYVQGDHSLEKKQGGLGIGLTLARSLVQMHEGSLEASSEGPDKGSEFVVRLPTVEPPPSRAKAKAGLAGSVRNVDPKRVLIVDDDQDNLRSLRRLLELIGHEVRIASDAQGTLDVVPEFVPDIALLDLGLPNMNGYDLVRWLRQIPRLEKTLFVAQTGLGREEDRRQSEAAGFDYHLVKPLSLDQLRGLIDASPKRD